MKRIHKYVALVLVLVSVCSMAAWADNVSAVQDYKQARALASGNRWKDALVYLQRALSADPGYDDAVYLAAICHMNLGENDKALPLIKRLTGMCPEFYQAWGLLAQIYVERKDFVKAREAAGGLGKVKGGKPESHYMLGNIAWMEGNVDLAEKEWREAIRLKPDMAKAHGNLGVLLHMKGDRVRAMTSLHDALRHNPESALYRLNMGLLQMEVGNKADATVNLDRVRSQSERPDLALLALAAQMFINGHPEQAEKAAGQAYAKNPDLTMAYLVRARALEKLKRAPEARELYAKVLEKEPLCKEAEQALARIPDPAAVPKAAPVATPAPASDGKATPAATPAPPSDSKAAPATSPAPATTPTPPSDGKATPAATPAPPSDSKATPAASPAPATTPTPATDGKATPADQGSPGAWRPQGPSLA